WPRSRRSVMVFSAVMELRRLRVLAVHRRDIENFRILGRMRMLGTGIDAQMAHLLPAQRTARHHALDRLDDRALGETAAERVAQLAFLDAAGITGVPVELLLLELLARDTHLGGVDDADMVAGIHMRGEGRLVLAAQAVRDDRREPAQHEAL